ncbi:MAG: glycosyltransferase, partial [Patescibacteria group bacterium]
MPDKKLISIIIPVFNEQENIPLIYERLLGVIGGLAEKYQTEIIFVDDGSYDKSPQVLEEIANKDQTVKLIQFSRNFGKEIAVSAGLFTANGQAVVMID